MGMFDTVFVSREVLSGLPFDCPACGRVPGPDAEWQTKSLNAAMDSYVLRHDDGGAIRLYLLDRPSDRRLWRRWTEEEIAASERDAARGGLFALWRKKPGEGCFLPEAICREPAPALHGRAAAPVGGDPRPLRLREYVERHVKFSDGVPSRCAPSRRATSRGSSTTRARFDPGRSRFCGGPAGSGRVVPGSLSLFERDMIGAKTIRTAGRMARTGYDGRPGRTIGNEPCGPAWRYHFTHSGRSWPSTRDAKIRQQTLSDHEFPCPNWARRRPEALAARIAVTLRFYPA